MFLPPRQSSSEGSLVLSLTTPYRSRPVRSLLCNVPGVHMGHTQTERRIFELHVHSALSMGGSSKTHTTTRPRNLPEIVRKCVGYLAVDAHVQDLIIQDVVRS